jgi:parvulin-like peptidyl-prolyl isomerase
MASEKEKKFSAKKVLVSVIIGFVAVAFVGSFAYRYISGGGESSSIAIINGEPVSTESDSLFANIYRQFYEEERQKAEGEPVTEEMDQQLLRRALDTVIQRTLILQYAENEGIRASRDAVLSRIIEKGYYAGQGKKFDENRYNDTPEATKQRIYKSEEEQLIIGMFIEDFISTVKVSDLELESFHNYTDFGKKIEYVFVRYDDIAEGQLREFYNENPKLFERAHAAHILIKEDEEKASEIYREVKRDPDRFEEFAIAESADPSGEKGGDLGWFYRGDMVAEFSEAAFNLKKDEIGLPVKTVFGYHIIKALDAPQVQTYEEALFRLKQEYVREHREEVEKKTAEKSKSIIERLGQNPDLFGDTTREFKLQSVKTDFITVDGAYILNEEGDIPLFELMNIPSLIELVFSTEKGKVGGPVKTADGEIIFKVVEEKEFDETEFQNTRDYLTQYYTSLKENFLFNDWYVSALRKSKIVDNFNLFFKETGS